VEYLTRAVPQKSVIEATNVLLNVLVSHGKLGGAVEIQRFEKFSTSTWDNLLTCPALLVAWC